MIYHPREDSFLLEPEVRKLATGKTVLDVGTGSGIQARAAIVAKAKSVLACDINLEAVNHLKTLGIYAVQSDLFSNIMGRFDLIIFNPPYLPRDSREDKESSLTTTGGKRGDEIILRFLKDAPSHLNDKGIILLVVSSLTPLDKINIIMARQWLKKEVLVSKKFFMEELFVWKISQS